MTPDLTRKIAEKYPYGIRFQLDVPVEDFVGAVWRVRHIPMEHKHKEILAKLEGKVFHTGFPSAMGFAAGECSLCLPQKECVVLTGGSCIHPLQARPAMEACGFDVFEIAETVGWKLVPIGHESKVKAIPCASLIGLVLVV